MHCSLNRGRRGRAPAPPGSKEGRLAIEPSLRSRERIPQFPLAIETVGFMSHDAFDFEMLSVEERLSLMGKIWDSFEPNDVALSTAQEEQLLADDRALKDGTLKTISADELHSRLAST